MASDRIARLRIQLDGIEPAIWRRIEVPLTTSLKGLHDAIQAVMGWQDYHLYQFEVGEKRYGVPDPEWEGMRPILTAKSTKLAAIIDRRCPCLHLCLRLWRQLAAHHHC